VHSHNRAMQSDFSAAAATADWAAARPSSAHSVGCAAFAAAAAAWVDAAFEAARSLVAADASFVAAFVAAFAWAVQSYRQEIYLVLAENYHRLMIFVVAAPSSLAAASWAWRAA